MINVFIWLMLFSTFLGLEMAFAFSNRLRLELSKDEDLHGRVSSFFFSRIPTFPNILHLLHILSFVFLCHSLLELVCGLSWTWTVVAVAMIVVLLFLSADGVVAVVGRCGATSFFSFFSYLLFFIYWVAYPFERVVVWLLSLFGLASSCDEMSFSINRVARDAFDDNQNQTQDNAEFGDEVKMFQNALDFSKVKIKDCLIPRTELMAVDIDTPIDELRNKFVESHFSRILVYKDTIDNVLGYIHSADMFDSPEDISSVLNPIIVVPETMTANKLLRLFLKRKKSLALVVDEFGGTSGIITIEDVMEEIFGEIEDEHDDDDSFEAKKVEENKYIISGRMEVENFNERFGMNLPVSEEYVTIGGLVLNAYGFLPKVHDEIVVDKKFRFKMAVVSSNRIDLVHLVVLKNHVE